MSDWEERAPSIGMRIFLTVCTVAAGAAVVYCLLCSLLLRPMTVTGEEMSPSLTAGSGYLMLFRSSDAPLQRGEIVVVDPPVVSDDPLWVRRVIATAGQTVSWDGDGHVLVDGVMLYESYAQPLSLPALPEPVTVPQGTVYVLADRRGAARDSSQPQVGCIALERVAGKVLYSWNFENGGTGDVGAE